MNCKMTNEEFHKVLSNLTFHYAPENYWNELNEQRKKHKFVGRKAFVYGEIRECTKAEDDLVFFKLSETSEVIIGGDEVENIKWIKE